MRVTNADTSANTARILSTIDVDLLRSLANDVAIVRSAGV